jgi:DNA-binding NtrC family response regulator
MNTFRIFIVEDDLWYADLLQKHLNLNPDYEVEKYATAKDCLNSLYKKPSVITIDFSLPDINGKELLKKIRSRMPDVPIIVISGQKDIDTAVELIKEGAFDYIVKNEDTPNRLWNSIRLLRENISLRQENEKLKREVGKKYDFSKLIIGESKNIRDIFGLIEKAADSAVTVSITGDTGTGKELVAKAIHYNSNRKMNPFVAINLGAIPKDLVESELFGYEKGAFTGAYASKPGIFEDAHKGTLFLDEIAEMDLNIQSKFLRVLQEREVRRIGGKESKKIDVRIITATHKNLPDEVSKANFRTDLFYRVMGLPIHLPPLRERDNDIILLARHFANEFSKENGRNEPTITREAMAKLMAYPYPGNIRELKATVELAMILSNDGNIDADNITFNPVGPVPVGYNDNMTLDEHVTRFVNDCLRLNGNNPTIVSRKLGISRATVYRYMRKG